jgi:hypothetical protein
VNKNDENSSKINIIKFDKNDYTTLSLSKKINENKKTKQTSSINNKDKFQKIVDKDQRVNNFSRSRSKEKITNCNLSIRDRFLKDNKDLFFTFKPDTAKQVNRIIENKICEFSNSNENYFTNQSKLLNHSLSFNDLSAKRNITTLNYFHFSDSLNEGKKKNFLIKKKDDFPKQNVYNEDYFRFRNEMLYEKYSSQSTRNLRSFSSNAFRENR